MAIEKLEIDHAKEIGDVGDALAKLVEDIKAKKALAVLAAENLPEIFEAIEGIDELDDEVREDMVAACQTMGLYTGRITGVLLKKSE